MYNKTKWQIPCSVRKKIPVCAFVPFKKTESKELCKYNSNTVKDSLLLMELKLIFMLILNS